MISAIVLAAGESTRMGFCKQLLEIEGQPMIEHILKSIQESNVDKIIVVLGFMADEIAKRVPEDKVKIVINPDYKAGQSTSLKAGLKAIDAKTEAVIFILADQPFMKASIINEIIRRYKRTHAPIVIPTYKGKRGNPVLFDKALFKEMLNTSGDVGARSIIRSHDKNVEEVEVNNPSVLYDIDTVEDLKILNKRGRK